MVILNAAELAAGKLMPEQLGVAALNAFTLRVRLETPTAYFVGLVAEPTFLPVPRQAVKNAQRLDRPKAWARPGQFSANGPFVLAEWRPYDYVKVVRNPNYYERDLVKLDEISFLPMAAGPPVISLYRAGLVQSMITDSLPPSLMPALRTAKDFRIDPQLALFFLSMDLRDPPFNNRLVRWAINMALDKRALSDFWFSEVARNVVPPMPGYAAPESLMVEIRGKRYDIMAYDPPGAREVLVAAGYPGGIGPDGRRLTFPLNADPATVDTAEIVSKQLQKALNIEGKVNQMEFVVEDAAQRAGTLRGFGIFGQNATFSDPYAFLSRSFMAEVVGWRDSDYYAELEAANKTLDPKLRTQSLARCEARLMEAMPLIPFSFYPSTYLAKPYVRGLKVNASNDTVFRYAWIDHGWKP